MKQSRNFRTLFSVLYYFTYLINGIFMVLKQPYGNPPDEHVRFPIPLYIAQNLKIPTGFEEELFIPTYGFSYASRPILPYMIQGLFVKIVSFFTDSADILLYAARFTNLFLGLIMAYIVLKLGEKWFADKRFAALFACAVTFLPQALFMHTYVNTDSCCLLSTALILYALQKGFEDEFSYKTCLLLAVGLVLCAMSYYNAYGYLLSAALLFTAFFIRRENGKLTFLSKPFLKKGSFLFIAVFLGAGWWFIRNGILRNGDFLSLKELHTLVNDDSVFFLGYFERTGESLFHMLTKSDYFTLSSLTFIAAFGATDIISTLLLYAFYKRFYFAGLVFQGIYYFSAAVGFLHRRKINQHQKPQFEPEPEKKLSHAFSMQTGTIFRLFWHLNMKFCILLPVLLSIHYSYHSDYEPQGRYWLPALVPLTYYSVAGIEKALKACEKLLRKSTGESGKETGSGARGRTYFTTLIVFLLCLATAVFLFVTIFKYALPAFAGIK